MMVRMFTDKWFDLFMRFLFYSIFVDAVLHCVRSFSVYVNVYLIHSSLKNILRFIQENERFMEIFANKYAPK